MAKIFISYRRADSQARTEQIYLRLIEEFGEENVFFDVEPGNIPEGEDFRRVLREEVQQCDVLLVIIGQRWLDIREAKNSELRRLDNKNDFVRIEVETGLNSSHIRTIPVLIDQTEPIDAEFLPESLQELAYKQARRVRGIPDFNTDMARLIAAIKRPPTTTQIPMTGTKKNGLPVWGIVVAIAVVMVILFAIYTFVLNDSDDEDEKSTPTTAADLHTDEVTEIADVPTETPVSEIPTQSPTRTETPTPTLSETEVEAAVQGQMFQIQTEAAQTIQAQETATSAMATGFAQATTYEEQTQIAHATETATLYTFTPTPDARKTAEARLTQTQESANATAAQAALDTQTMAANETETQSVINATATAALWTDTPTATFTPTDIPTLTAGEIAIQGAESGVSANDEWTPYLEAINGVEMVLVPAGCFMMGSENGPEDEQPAHEQCFETPFWIDRTEVTRAMYQACIDAGACTETPDNEYSIRDNQPINRVTWFQARDYCTWRGGRLPTEREWEYAARGPDNLIYPWGNEFVAENAVYRDNSGNETADVGSRESGASWVGALDLSGNVWEWVSTIYMEYPYQTDDGRESNSDTNSVRGLRGGSFYVIEVFLRAAVRVRLDPSIESLNYGFRCALSY